MLVQELIRRLQGFDGDATVNIRLEGGRSQVEIDDVRQRPDDPKTVYIVSGELGKA